MNTYTLRSQFYHLGCRNLTNPTSNSPVFLTPIKTTSHLKDPTYPSTTTPSKNTIQRQSLVHPHKHPVRTKHVDKSMVLELTPMSQKSSKRVFPQFSPNRQSRFVMFGAVSIGLALVLMGMDDHKALALGPEGPLVEEFWDNVRRYALYALTVSTGALYTILQPIVELLKNPISAVLILVILGGSLYIISQVLYAMVGVSDFSYDYGY